MNPLQSLLLLTKRSTILGQPGAGELLSEVQVADSYNLSRRTLQNWRYSKPQRGPAYQRAGRKILYFRDDVETWLASNRVEPGKCA